MDAIITSLVILLAVVASCWNGNEMPQVESE